MCPAGGPEERRGDTRPALAVGIVALSTLLAMSAWFSATFVVPELRVEWDLTPGGTAALTIAVQLGFVLGALLSAAAGIADAVPGPGAHVLWSVGCCGL